MQGSTGMGNHKQPGRRRSCCRAPELQTRRNYSVLSTQPGSNRHSLYHILLMLLQAFGVFRVTHDKPY